MNLLLYSLIKLFKPITSSSNNSYNLLRTSNKDILNNLLDWVINYDKKNLENIRNDFTKVFNKIYRSTYLKHNSKNLIISLLFIILSS